MTKYTSDYPINNVTVDAVVIAVPSSPALMCEVLTIVRGQEPHKGALALPGGFLGPHETAIDAAVRETLEETGFDIRADRYDLASLWPRTGPVRDPRGRTISLPYVFWVPEGIPRTVSGADDAETARWECIDRFLLETVWAFDHESILREAYSRTMNRRSQGFQWL